MGAGVDLQPTRMSTRDSAKIAGTIAGKGFVRPGTRIGRAFSPRGSGCRDMGLHPMLV